MSTFESFTDAAYRLLAESGAPRHYRWLTEEAIRRGLVQTFGRTPWKTMNARLNDEIKTAVPGKTVSRFARTERGMFGLAEWEADPAAERAKPSGAEQSYFVFIVNDAPGSNDRVSAQHV